MSTHKRFYEWEKDFIRLAYPIFTRREIGTILDRSPAVIKNVARSFGVQKQCLVSIGDQYGALTVVEHLKKTGSGRKCWKCLCECGKFTNLSTTGLIVRGTKSCGCKILSKLFTGYKNITGTWFGLLKRGAKSRNLTFQITIEYINDLYEKQNRKCALTGVDLYIHPGRVCKKTTASLDRIDNTKGYIEGNVQFLHKDVNRLKLDHTQEHFIKWCKLIAEYNKDK